MPVLCLLSLISRNSPKQLGMVSPELKKLVATLSSYGRRAVVVGGVADRYASELARAGQSNRRRAGTGSASPQRATRPPLWPAGMAAGNRATFGPRVGLSSHGSPAKGGPKSKCLARLKIARTSAGPPSLTISDPSRFPPAFRNDVLRSCRFPAFCVLQQRNQDPGRRSTTEAQRSSIPQGSSWVTENVPALSLIWMPPISPLAATTTTSSNAST